MRDVGYIKFFGVECILVEENNCISIIPKEKGDIEKIRPHFDDRNFIFTYTVITGYNSIAYIERMECVLNYTIKLYPYYIVNLCHVNSFRGFELADGVVDDFFSPAYYFYNRFKSGAKTNVDFIYQRQKADEWSIIFEEKTVSLTLSFGAICSIACDLKLQPKLMIKFEQAEDVQYVYRVYKLIVRFLQIIRYDTSCGKMKINLFGAEKKKVFDNGYLHDFSFRRNYCVQREWRSRVWML